MIKSALLSLAFLVHFQLIIMSFILVFVMPFQMYPPFNGGRAYRVLPVRVCVCVCVCVFQFRVRPMTSLCTVGFKNNLAHMIIKTSRCVAYKNQSLGQRSRSQVALKMFAF